MPTAPAAPAFPFLPPVASPTNPPAPSSWTFGTPAAFLVAIIALLMNSCTPAAAVPDGEVRTTTARDLVRNYRDEPGPADLAYTGQVVRVSLRTFDRQPDGSLVWKVLYRPDLPPALVVRFAPDSAPGKLDAPVWVEGTCRGRADDDLDRGSPGYRFRVLITGARVVPPPS